MLRKPGPERGRWLRAHSLQVRRRRCLSRCRRLDPHCRPRSCLRHRFRPFDSAVDSASAAHTALLGRRGASQREPGRESGDCNTICRIGMYHWMSLFLAGEPVTSPLRSESKQGSPEQKQDSSVRSPPRRTVSRPSVTQKDSYPEVPRRHARAIPRKAVTWAPDLRDWTGSARLFATEVRQ
jgi:hypothetical protein